MMPENETGGEKEQVIIEEANFTVEKYSEIIQQVDQGTNPEILAGQQQTDVLDKLLRAVGILLVTVEGEDKIKFVKRFRLLEKALRIKLTEQESEEH